MKKLIFILGIFILCSCSSKLEVLYLIQDKFPDATIHEVQDREWQFIIVGKDGSIGLIQGISSVNGSRIEYFPAYKLMVPVAKKKGE